MMRHTPAIIKFSGFIALCIVVLSYGLWQSRLLIQGPVITITTPLNGAIVSDTHTNLTGQVKNVSYITLNGRQIYADEYGNINEPLWLPEGYNIIQVSGTDKFGRSITRTLELVARDPGQTTEEIVHDASISATN